MSRVQRDYRLYFKIACDLGSLSAPIITTALFQETAGVITLIFLGRLKSAEFQAAATLGNMMCNITGYSLAYGFCTGLDSLISNAYGAKLFRLTGLYTQRAIVILSLFTIPTILLWRSTEFILHAFLGIPTEIAHLSGEWSKIIAIGLWPSLIFEILRKFLQGQQLVWPVLVASLTATICTGVSNYLLDIYFKLGFYGAAYSVALSQWISLIVLVVLILVRRCYVFSLKLSTKSKPSYQFVELDDFSVHGNNYVNFSDVHNAIRMQVNTSDEHYVSGDVISFGDTNLSRPHEVGGEQDLEVEAHLEDNPEDNWPPPSRDIFTDWQPFFMLGVPGAVSLFVEWGSFELVAGIAGQLGTVPLAVHGVFMSTAGLFYMAPNAFASATSTLAGNFLGDDNPNDAKLTIYIGIFVDFLWGVTAGLFLLLILRPYWGLMYTDDRDVQEMIYDCLPIMFVYLSVDSTKCITLNVLRSTGRPSITVLWNTLACIVVMLPLGWFLAIHHSYGLNGLWSSMSLAWLIATIVYLYIIISTDWTSQAENARDRNSAALNGSTLAIGTTRVDTSNCASASLARKQDDVSVSSQYDQNDFVSIDFSAPELSIDKVTHAVSTLHSSLE